MWCSLISQASATYLDSGQSSPQPFLPVPSYKSPQMLLQWLSLLWSQTNSAAWGWRARLLSAVPTTGVTASLVYRAGPIQTRRDAGSLQKLPQGPSAEESKSFGASFNWCKKPGHRLIQVKICSKCCIQPLRRQPVHSSIQLCFLAKP